MTERELFKEAVMQYMVDDAQVERVSKRRKTHPVARRVLFAAACLLVAMSVTVFSIPSARAAVEKWISGWFSTREYFGQEKEERTKEPTIEAIITNADENSAKVTEIGAGYESYAGAFDMTLDEIAYDGTSIYLSGTMSGVTARPFVEAQTGGDTFRAAKYDGSLGDNAGMEYYYFACENTVKFITADGKEYEGEIVPTFTTEMHEISDSLIYEETHEVFENGELLTSNREADEIWDDYLSDHDVRFSIELQCYQQEKPPLSGMVDGDLSLQLFYCNVGGKDPTQVLQASFGTIMIDANAYQAQTKTTQAEAGTSVNLGGVHPVTIHERQPEAERTQEKTEVYYYTHELDFSEVIVSLKEISFTPTDTKIVLHVVLPGSWTGAERFNGGPTFHFLLDGEAAEEGENILFLYGGQQGTYDATGEALEYDCTYFESTLSPSEWANIKTLTIIPTTTYWWDMLVNYDNGPYETFSLRDGAVHTGYVNHTSYQFDELFDEMTQYALTINLDDYR